MGGRLRKVYQRDRQADRHDGGGREKKEGNLRLIKEAGYNLTINLGGTRLTPDLESYKISDLTQVFKPVPPSVFVVFVFDQLSKKGAIFVPRRPQHMSPILRCKVTSVNHQPTTIMVHPASQHAAA